MSTQSKEQQQIGFLSLCYHYIRPDNDDPFSRLMGTKITEFKNQIKMLKEKFEMISLDDVLEFIILQWDFKKLENDFAFQNAGRLIPKKIISKLKDFDLHKKSLYFNVSNSTKTSLLELVFTLDGVKNKLKNLSIEYFIFLYFFLSIKVE